MYESKSLLIFESGECDLAPDSLSSSFLLHSLGFSHLLSSMAMRSVYVFFHSTYGQSNYFIKLPLSPHFIYLHHLHLISKTGFNL